MSTTTTRELVSQLSAARAESRRREAAATEARRAVDKAQLRYGIAVAEVMRFEAASEAGVDSAYLSRDAKAAARESALAYAHLKRCVKRGVEAKLAHGAAARAQLELEDRWDRYVLDGTPLYAATEDS